MTEHPIADPQELGIADPQELGIADPQELGRSPRARARSG
jgi:hypothetical protein